jgi:hypothetical protein
VISIARRGCRADEQSEIGAAAAPVRSKRAMWTRAASDLCIFYAGAMSMRSKRSLKRSVHAVRLVATIIFLLVCTGMASATASMTLEEVLQQPEQEQRKAIIDTVGRWFLAEDFAEIEDLSDKARREHLRTSSGLWVEGLVFAGIDSVANYKKVTIDAGWDQLEAIAGRWVKAYPASATAKVAYGDVLHNRAWVYRGGGYAHTVSDEQFAAFYKQIGKAKRYQLANRAVMTTDPNGYLSLLATMRVEKKGRQEEFEQTFSEAIRAFPDYYPIYFEAVTYYLPKWNGNAFEVEKFARRIMKSRDARTGRMLYARIYWYASQSQFKDNIFLVSVARWSDMREGFEAIVADYPDQWNINHYAKFACLVVDQETTRRAFDMLKGDPIDKAWDSTDQYEECRHFAGRIST